jgi:hypothetical protein
MHGRIGTEEEGAMPSICSRGGHSSTSYALEVTRRHHMEGSMVEAWAVEWPQGLLADERGSVLYSGHRVP